MKERICHAALLFVALTFVVVFPASGAVPAGPDEAAIDKVRLAFNTSYNAGDVKALAQLLDRDAVWMPPTGEGAITGMDKIVARYATFFEKTRSIFELKAGMIQVSGHWAFLSGLWARTDTPKAGGVMTRHAGHYLLVLKKQRDGSWKIFRDIWNDGLKP